MQERPTRVEGRAWVLRDAQGRPIDDIDTDMIYHNAHLAVTDVAEMGRYALGNLAGWEHFAAEARPGDIVVAGANFGAGSSRQHAVDCFAALGVSCIIAESFGAIYKRNAINSGFPVAVLPNAVRLMAEGRAAVETGDVLAVDFETGAAKNLTTGRWLEGMAPFSGVQLDIYRAGNLFRYGAARS